MKLTSNLVMAGLVGALMASGAAMASAPDTAFNTIKSIDARAGTVSLADGTSYTVPYGLDLSRFHVGERVAIIWNADGTNRDAVTITAG